MPCAALCVHLSIPERCIGTGLLATNNATWAQQRYLKGKGEKRKKKGRKIRPHIYKKERQRCKSPADGGESGEEQSGRNSLWCGYIIVVLNRVISSLSHSPGVAQMGESGGRAPGIMLACFAAARWGQGAELLAGEQKTTRGLPSSIPNLLFPRISMAAVWFLLWSHPATEPPGGPSLRTCPARLIFSRFLCLFFNLHCDSPGVEHKNR